jgi:hypothetical protein
MSGAGVARVGDVFGGGGLSDRRLELVLVLELVQSVELVLLPFDGAKEMSTVSVSAGVGREVSVGAGVGRRAGVKAEFVLEVGVDLEVVLALE